LELFLVPLIPFFDFLAIGSEDEDFLPLPDLFSSGPLDPLRDLLFFDGFDLVVFDFFVDFFLPVSLGLVFLAGSDLVFFEDFDLLLEGLDLVFFDFLSFLEVLASLAVFGLLEG
jgi:hypothetical protein